MTAEYQVHGDVAVITLNNPPVNGLGLATRQGIVDALATAEDDAAVKVVVITGSPPVFSAGFDLREFEAAQTDEDLNRRLWASSDRWHRTLRTFPLPLIASINGAALAGGFDLATMCDLLICSTSAFFGRPEIGFSPPIYSIVHDLLGGALARELAFTDRRIDAPEAARLGLVSKVVPDDELADATRAWADQVLKAPVEGLRHSKAMAIAGAKVATDAELAW